MDEATRSRLEQRTKRVGAAVEAKTSSRDLGRFVGFRVQDTVIGIPVSVVHEFAPLATWVPLGGCAHVLGICQLRGEVMTLVDLFEALTGRHTETGQWMVVLQGRGGRTAAPVSEVLGTRTVLESDLAPRNQIPPLCPGVATVTTDMWWLLDAAALTTALDPEPVERPEPGRSEPGSAAVS